MIQSVDDISIVGPSGELDLHEGKMLIRKIGNLIRYAWNKIVLDLQEVDHIHFQFLAELSQLSKMTLRQSGGIKLANLSRYNRELLRLAGVEGQLESYDSVAEAVLSFDPPVVPSCEMQ